MDKYIGKTLDNRYEILEIMGIGGMAYVYKARCHLLNRFVAIKILKEEYARDADFRRRFHAESQAVAMLSHPNIMAVYDVSRSKELEYIVMELIDGITLKQYMQRKGLLSWREGLHFAIQIVKALSHAHSRGIIHRDIKPHNIMILRDGSVKVADFGIARFASKQNTLTQEALGSVHYISPEQARGSHIDARSDIYSVGVVLYEMLTEQLPFEGDSPVSVALQHISSLPLGPREINPDIPEALEMIVIKAMAPKLTKRYASAEEMLKDLEEFRKNPSISFEYDVAELQTAADEGPEEPTRSLPGGAKGKGLKLDA
ncbi:MAG: protein kinase, partial [Oscillospiraceae bacterium]|nr:protein kinase [Oscillospiraceae bacterium]